jgi:integrase
MSTALTVTPRHTQHGVVYDVYFRHCRKRIRFTIEDARTYQDATRKATKIRDGVVAGRLAFTRKADRAFPPGTFGNFRKMYEKELQVEQVADIRRPLGIVDNILLPRWGHVPFAELSRQHALDLILDLRNKQYAEQGVRRIINVARRFLHLAIRHRLTTHNPFADLPLQAYEARDRIASDEELRTLLRLGSARMQDAIALAFNLPLREELIITASRDYRYTRADGVWYRPPKAPTTIKGRPLELPLNQTAASLLDLTDSLQPLLFPGWTPNLFGKSWRRLTRRAHIEDLHFHDLRRNAGSLLQAAHVHPGVISLLLGHKSKEVTDIYKTFDSWRPDLIKAVTILDEAWRRIASSQTHSRSGHAEGAERVEP